MSGLILHDSEKPQTSHLVRLRLSVYRRGSSGRKRYTNKLIVILRNRLISRPIHSNSVVVSARRAPFTWGRHVNVRVADNVRAYHFMMARSLRLAICVVSDLPKAGFALLALKLIPWGILSCFCTVNEAASPEVALEKQPDPPRVAAKAFFSPTSIQPLMSGARFWWSQAPSNWPL